MKKLIFKILFLTLLVCVPGSAMAGVSVHFNIPLPPPIFFPTPPSVVVIPETNVYAVPDIQDDIFFYGGWWWRPWEDRWYRSRHYDRGWAYYRGVPSFNRQVPPGWRNDFNDHRWKGYEWNHQRVPNQELRRNWRGWEKNKYWERNNAWGVQGLQQHRKPPRNMQNKHREGQKRGPQTPYGEPHHGPGPEHSR